LFKKKGFSLLLILVLSVILFSGFCTAEVLITDGNSSFIKLPSIDGMNIITVKPIIMLRVNGDDDGNTGG